MWSKAHARHPTNADKVEEFAHFRFLGFSDFSHEGQINGLELWCQRILRKAGFPDDPTGKYSPQSGELCTNEQEPDKCDLIGLVAPGRKWPDRTLPVYHFNSPEAFAARMLLVLSKFRRLYEAGDIDEALYVNAYLWLLAGRAEVKFTLQAYSRQGRESARGHRWCFGIQHVINSLVEKKPDKSAKQLWMIIATMSKKEIVDGHGYTVYRERDELVQINHHNGKEKAITFRSFERYVERAKSRLHN